FWPVCAAAGISAIPASSATAAIEVRVAIIVLPFHHHWDVRRLGKAGQPERNAALEPLAARANCVPGPCSNNRGRHVAARPRRCPCRRKPRDSAPVERCAEPGDCRTAHPAAFASALGPPTDAPCSAVRSLDTASVETGWHTAPPRGAKRRAPTPSFRARWSHSCC